MHAATGIAEGAILRLKLSASPLCQPADGTAAVPLQPRDAALLAWLAIEGPTPRTRLAALLWPDSGPEAARNALRQRLFQLKKQLGAELVSGQATLALAHGVHHDLEESDSVLGDAAHEHSPEFVAWLAQQRARRTGRMRAALVELAEMAERAHDHADALAHADELLVLEPLSEDAHRRVIRLHYLRGDRAAALLAFDRCEAALKSEVGTRPSAETLALLSTIESQRAEPALRPRLLPVGLQRPPRVIGRGRELDAVVQAWSAGDPFLVLGEAGIGKTRLLDTLAQRWPGAVLVSARPGDGNVPLVLIGRLVDALCDRQPNWAAAACVQTLRELLGAVPDSVPQASRSRPLPRPCAQPLRDLLALSLAATPPLALLLDDLQFADEPSVAVLDDVLAAPALAGLRWGWASRTHGELAAPRIETLRRRTDLHCVNLQPLDLPAITEFVDALHLGGVHAQAAQGLASALSQRVGGNPMFLLETLRRMVDSGRAFHESQIQAPQRVHNLVADRLDALPAPQRSLMRIAAVAGADFELALAEAASGRDALELADDWRALERLALFDPRGIAHDLYAEATLAEVPPAVAKTLHARVAAWLELRHREPAQVAAHWLAAQEDLRAQPHLLAAARKAWRAACADETLQFFRQAAEIGLRHGSPDQAFDQWFEAADALSEIGSPALLQRCAEALQPLARSAQQRVRVRLVRAALQHVSGQTEAGLRSMRDLLGDAIALGDTRVEAECRYAIAHRACADGLFDESLQQLAAAERLLRETGDARRAAALSSSMAMVLALRGQSRLAIAEQQRLLPLLQAHGDHATWAVGCASLALQRVYSAECDSAVDEAERAVQVAERASIAPPDLQIVMRSVTEALCWAGRFDLALAAAHALTSRLAQQGQFPACGDVLGLLYLRLGRADLAQPHLSAYLALPFERRRDQLRSAWLRALRARWSSPAPPIDDWPADALRCEDLALASAWGLLSGLTEGSPWSAGDIAALAERCDAEGMVLLGLPLRALQARRMIDAGDLGPGCALAQTVEADWAGRDLCAGTPWAALFLAQALHLAERIDAARRVAQLGLGWIERTARDAMPAEFSDSFARRNPLNAELMALASRLLASAG